MQFRGMQDFLGKAEKLLVLFARRFFIVETCIRVQEGATGFIFEGNTSMVEDLARAIRVQAR